MTSRSSRKAGRTFFVGLGVFVVIGVLGYLAVTAHTGLPFSETTTVKAAFDDVDSLQSGDEVRENSMRIGRVSAIEFVRGHAVVDMELDGDRVVHRDARAAILDLSALGTKFVELYPGTPSSGALGSRVIDGRNIDSADLYEVLNVLDERTRAAATSTIREAGGGVAGHSRDLHDLLQAGPDLLSDLGTVSSGLASEQADLPSLLRSADRLAERFAGREQQVAALVEQSDATLRAISVDDTEPLSDSLDSLPGVLGNARAALDELDAPLADTETALTTMQPGAAALGDSTDDLRGVLREGIRPLELIPGVAEQAEPAVADLTRTFADARPLAPRVAEAFGDLATPLQVLAPYAPELGQLGLRGQSYLSAGPSGRHYARFTFDPGLSTATGGVLQDEMTIPYNAYPAPGEASGDRAGLSSRGDR